MKLFVVPRKPRNPLVAPSLRRKAGRHRAGTGAARRAGRMALRRELQGSAAAGP